MIFQRVRESVREASGWRREDPPPWALVDEWGELASEFARRPPAGRSRATTDRRRGRRRRQQLLPTTLVISAVILGTGGAVLCPTRAALAGERADEADRGLSLIMLAEAGRVTACHGLGKLSLAAGKTSPSRARQPSALLAKNLLISKPSLSSESVRHHPCSPFRVGPFQRG